MSIVTSCELGQAICSVFGLDAHHVGKITITLEARDVARVSIERCVTKDETRQLATVLEKYQLVACEPAGDPQSVSEVALMSGCVKHGKPPPDDLPYKKSSW